MTIFQLFCLMYKAFDTVENHADFSFEDFLSDMDPYIWNDEGSADPAEYEEFFAFMKDKTIGDDFGYSLVTAYISCIERCYVDRPLTDYFAVSKQKWIDMAKEYLSLKPSN